MSLPKQHRWRRLAMYVDRVICRDCGWERQRLRYDGFSYERRGQYRHGKRNVPLCEAAQ